MKILIKISGSISVFKICLVVSKLVKQGHKVKVATTLSSLKFVGTSTWEGLSGNKVFCDDFTPGQRLDHIYLNDWADLIVLAPATAQTLNVISNGVGSNVITTLFLARKKTCPYLIFPAMNPRMWETKTVQQSVEKLKSFDNVRVFKPKSGSMACSHNGVGRLNEPSFILNEILKFDIKNKKALITLGGTTEDIDGVRQITNFSSGETGLEIAKALKKHYEVTVVASKQALKNALDLEGIRLIPFLNLSDLTKELKNLLESKVFDLIIHAAAISDFLPIKKQDKKISSLDDFVIEFKKAPKILNSLKKWSKNKNSKLISFKLTHNQSSKEIIKKINTQFQNSKSDFIILNELKNINLNKHEYSIWPRDAKTFSYSGETKIQMIQNILTIKGL